MTGLRAPNFRQNIMTMLSTFSINTPASLSKSGLRMVGSIKGTILVAGFNGIAVTTWADGSRAKTIGRSNDGLLFAGTYPRSRKIADRRI